MAIKEAHVEERRLDRILSFTKEEQNGYKTVLLFLSAVGKVALGRVCSAHFSAGELDNLFVIFCEKLALEGSYFDSNLPVSPAVTLWLGYEADGESCSPVVFPYQYYRNAKWRIDEHPDKQRVLEAATEVCRAWLPDWNWSVPE